MDRKTYWVIVEEGGPDTRFRWKAQTLDQAASVRRDRQDGVTKVVVWKRVPVRTHLVMLRVQ